MTEENQTPESRPGEFERISPAYVRLDEPEAQPGYQEPESPISTGIVVWALFGLLCLAGAVFLWLPGEVADREQQLRAPAPTTDNNKPAAAPASAKPQNKQDASAAADESLTQLEKVEQLRAEVVKLRADLQAAEAPKWAAEAWQGLNHLFDKGERELQARNFDLAEIAFGEARQTARNISKNEEATFIRLMKAGRENLEAGDPEAAMKSFDMALTMRPKDQEALKYMDRSIKRGDVLEYMREGRNLETAEDIVGARDVYVKAVALDSEFQPAVLARDRTQALINDRAFRARLSEGLEQMERGDYETAKVTLESAGRLRPGSDEVEDALAQVNATLQARKIGAQKYKAAAAEQAEQWRDAEAVYQAMLAEDASLEFARAGGQQAAQRAKLDEALAARLDNRARLADAAVREEARALLTRAEAVETPGPRLQGQIDKLENALEAAETPVSLTLRSDGSTRVLVHHVGELGSFEQRQLELLPGEYTAVGSREGYRDVRVNFLVPPGAASAQPVRIVCQDKI